MPDPLSAADIAEGRRLPRPPKVPHLTDAELTDIVRGHDIDGVHAIERVPEEQILFALAELLTLRALKREINDMTRPSEIDQEASGE